MPYQYEYGCKRGETTFKGCDIMRIKPARLKKGDTVGIIAPASPPDSEKLLRSFSFLEELGLNIKLGKHVNDQYGYLAGRDQARLDDIHAMFCDKEVKAIFCARGGYGTGRIAAQMDYVAIKENPKIFWGYSDITFLHLAIRKRTGLITFHGPMLASDIGSEEVHELSKEGFKQLFDPIMIQYTNETSPLETIVEGQAAGEVTGGNLTLITSTLGTPFEIDTCGKLLFIEDISEPPRSVDRMLNQLYMSGKLTDAAGLIIGDFNDCVPGKGPSLSLEEVISHYAKLAGRPAMKGFKMGHCSPNIAIPLGASAEIDTFNQRLIVESGIC